MANPYFNDSTTLVALTRGRASTVEAKFNLVTTGFDGVNTDMLLRGLKTGDTWTGTQNFTGATLTAATQTPGDSSTKVATTAFVAAQAFSSTLPAQAGNSGKALTTNGATASWGSIGVAGGGTGLASFTIGDIMYASGATTLTALAGVATGNAMISGGVGTAPAWGKVGLSTHVSGTLGAASGGTGVANNAASTVTISGSFGLTLTLTAISSVTLPTTGTLATLTGIEIFTNKTLTSPAITGGSISGGTTITGGTIDNATIGGTTRAAGSFTTITANSDSSFTSTGALTLSSGTTAQRPATAVAKVRFNTDLAQFEGWTGGSVWAPMGSGFPANTFSAALNIGFTDNGLSYTHPAADTTARTVTFPANGTTPLPIGFCTTLANEPGAGALTIAVTTDTLYWAGVGSTGNRTVAAGGLVTVLKVSATRWFISGSGLS